jgi:cell division protein FtsZ
MALMDADSEGLKYEIQEESRGGARIKVVGVGGGGCNAVARMHKEGLEGVEFYAVNTDIQALSACQIPNRLQIGAKITNGLGAGSNPDIGRQAALENTDRLVELLQGADMVFVTASLGGGTGTGAAPVIASLAKELDALTVAMVTKPFSFEGPRRMRLAEEGLAKLASSVDTVITVPNDRLLSLVPRGTSFFEAFKVADDLLRQAVQNITDIIATPGLVNRDFSDIKATMLGMGYAVMGTAVAHGENAAVEAARQAICCPLLEDSRLAGASIAGARGILVYITGASRLGLHEVHEACSIIREAAGGDDVQINFGIILDEALADAVKVTVIATGFQAETTPASEKIGDLRAQLQSPELFPAPARAPEPEPIAAIPEVEPEPALIADTEPAIDLDDLDTPAYLRQGRLLN